MSPSALNPYAAPAPPGAAVPESGPLPAGVRRFQFDPEQHRTTVRSRLLRFQAIFLGLIAVVGFGICRTVEPAAFAAWLFVVVGALVVLTVRVRRMARRSLATYDLLVGPRVMRRTIAGFGPSEVLRPEVRSAFETRWGIWLCCDVPPHAFFVSSAIAGYKELRGTLGTWAAIEPAGGWTAWRRARSAGARQGERNAVAGTALASDIPLANELAEIRQASSTAWMAHPQLPKNSQRLRRLLFLWALLIVFFVALWLFLAPDPRPRSPPRPFPPGASSAPIVQ